jgi:hypothetical protein
MILLLIKELGILVFAEELKAIKRLIEKIL